MHQDIIQLLQIPDVETRLNIIQTLSLPSLVDGLLEQKNKRSIILSIAQHAPSMEALFSKQEEKNSVQSLSIINKLFENLAGDGNEVVGSTLYELMNSHSHAPWMARLIELIQSETLLKALCWKGNWSALIFNAFRGNRPLCNAFIEKLDAKTLGKVCQQADQKKNTPLHLLFQHQDEANCILLLKKLELKEQELKERISQICDEGSWTPLHFALRHQNIQVLQFLLNQNNISPWWIQGMHGSLNSMLLLNYAVKGFVHDLFTSGPYLNRPKESLQEHPAKFLAFIHRHVNTKKILDAHRWVELIKTALSDYDPGDDVEKQKIRGELSLLLSEVYLYLEYHSAGEEKHPVDYRINMRGVYFSLKQPGQLTAEQNLRIGEELTVMLGTTYWQALEAKSVEELTLPSDARLWISLVYAPDCHSALYQGLQHFLQAIRQTTKEGTAEEDVTEEKSTVMIREGAKSLFLNYLQVDEEKSNHILLDTWLEDENKQDSLIPQKLAQIKQRSEQLKQWQWHEFSRELMKSLKQPHTAEERAFFLILLPLKFKFEIVASSSYKEAHRVLDALLKKLNEEISSLQGHSTYSLGLEQIESSLHTIKKHVPLPDLPREEKIIEHPENNPHDFFPSEIKRVEREPYREEKTKQPSEETLSIPLLTYSIFASEDDEDEKFTQSREMKINAVHDEINSLKRQSRLELSKKLLLKIAEKIIELDTHSRSCLRAPSSQTTLRRKCDLLLELYFEFKHLINSQFTSSSATEVITYLNRLKQTEIKIFCYWFGTSSFSLSPCSLFAKRRQTSTIILINQVYEYTKPLTREQNWELSIGPAVN